MPRPLNQTDTDLNAENLLRLPAEFGCPVWVYDAQIVREKIAALHQFDVVRFAQKACSNIHILRLMREQGVKVDSVSLGEIERALAAGFDPKADGDAIVFTADVIDDATLARMAGMSSSMLCECPRHVAEIIAQLVSFEQYSQECLNKTSEDARLHAYLHSVSGSARALFEHALQMLAEHEGLALQEVECIG